MMDIKDYVSIVHINNINEGVISPIKMFADDCIMMREIMEREDRSALCNGVVTQVADGF